MEDHIQGTFLQWAEPSLRAIVLFDGKRRGQGPFAADPAKLQFAWPEIDDCYAFTLTHTHRHRSERNSPIIEGHDAVDDLYGGYFRLGSRHYAMRWSIGGHFQGIGVNAKGHKGLALRSSIRRQQPRWLPDGNKHDQQKQTKTRLQDHDENSLC